MKINRTGIIIKKNILVIIFAFMFLHMIYMQFNFIRIPPLKGDIKYAERALFNCRDWFNGSFQQQFESHLNDTFGFRSLYVRLNNQIKFSCFKKINAKNVVLGKENYLYEKNYINAYTGKDFLGAKAINEAVARIKFISDTLAKLNKQLIIVFAAGKASFYPEYIPNEYLPASRSTNYLILSEIIKNKGINYIDFNKWFIQQKKKTVYELYPKYANHWSTYGAVLAADSIIHYIEDKRKIDMPDLIYDKIDLKKPFGFDYDIADGMNLLFKFKSNDLAYPRIFTESDKNKNKPRVLVISDSFYWNMFYFGISKSFKNDHFWYYNKQVYPESHTKELLVTSVNFDEEINKHDVFIVMATEASLPNFGWGFLETLEKKYQQRTN